MTGLRDWVFASRTRLLVAVAVLVLGPVLVAVSVTTEPPTAPASSPTPATPTGTPSGTPTGTPEAAAEPPEGPRARAAAQRATTAYLRAFFDASLSDARWRARTEAHATDALAAANRTVPRNVIPRARLLRVRVTGTAPGYAELTAQLTGALTLDVAAVRDTQGRWRVDEVAPEQ